MSEQRLIDVNAIKLHRVRHDMSGYTDLDDVEEYIDSLPTIDPETLSVVQELRVELKELNAKYNLALSYLKQAADDNGHCYGCLYLDETNDKCKHPFGMSGCSSDWGKNDHWTWKGESEWKDRILYESKLKEKLEQVEKEMNEREQVHAHWEPFSKTENRGYRCSHCKKARISNSDYCSVNHRNYCYNCGAKMDEEE